ncbi:putative beta helix incomplete domain containing protein [Pandoravirus japonicus]|uniref:Beta helix incomplete domain containing protein n=1 Tax=Pandoravirus japonicus TaxID=2823154 RepID=A0A811BS19_9VIRU|nr:putative beta helix incomplete domain containing protein [Pandoravirus japonicus]
MRRATAPVTIDGVGVWLTVASPNVTTQGTFTLADAGASLCLSLFTRACILYIPSKVYAFVQRRLTLAWGRRCRFSTYARTNTTMCACICVCDMS